MKAVALEAARERAEVGDRLHLPDRPGARERIGPGVDEAVPLIERGAEGIDPGRAKDKANVQHRENSRPRDEIGVDEVRIGAEPRRVVAADRLESHETERVRPEERGVRRQDPKCPRLPGEKVTCPRQRERVTGRCSRLHMVEGAPHEDDITQNHDASEEADPRCRGPEAAQRQNAETEEQHDHAVGQALLQQRETFALDGL